MDGTSISFPVAIVFLGITSGLEDQINGAAMFLIVFISTIGSAGTAPIPASGLVMILTAFNTVFDFPGTPDSFSSIIAVDFFIERLCTSLNVTGDMVICRIVTALTSERELEVLNKLALDKVKKQVNRGSMRRMSMYEKDREGMEFQAEDADEARV